MDGASANLVTLPVEILVQIFSYLIPSGQIYRARSLLPKKTHKKQVKKGRHHEVRFYCWKKKGWTTWGTKGHQNYPRVLSLFRLHSTIYPVVLVLFYSRNTFWFPDPYTLNELAVNRLSPLAKDVLESVRVDACGLQTSTVTCRGTYTVFEHDADLSIADTIHNFRGLRRLTLGGVGPGLFNAINWSDEEIQQLMKGPDGSLARLVLPPGPVGVHIGENKWVWPSRCIALVAAIVGIDANRRSEDSEREPTVCSGGSEEPTRKSGPLKGATVLCAQLEKSEYNLHSASTGHKRRMATHIVKCGESVDIGEYEMKLEVAEALERSQLEDRRRAEWDDRIANLGGFLPVSDYEMQLMLLEEQNKRRMALARQAT